MKKLTGLLVVAALAMLSAAPLYAQKKEMSTMDLLKNGVWEVQNEFKDRPVPSGQPDERVDWYMVFSDSTWTTCSITKRTTDRRMYGGSELYYLSDEIVKEEKDFDDSKIGKVKNGKYIITKRFYGPEEEGAFRVTVREIIKLDDKEVVLLQPGIIVGGGWMRMFKVDKKLWQDPKTGKVLAPPTSRKRVSYSIE